MNETTKDFIQIIPECSNDELNLIYKEIRKELKSRGIFKL